MDNDAASGSEEFVDECGWTDWQGEARAAIAEVFDWLANPSDAAIEDGRWPAEDDGPHACWTAMLTTLRREALGDEK